MSVTGGFKPTTAHSPAPWPQWVRDNVAQWFRLLGRAPRTRAVSTLAWRAPLRLAIGAVIVTVLIAGAMFAFDTWAIKEAQRLPLWLITVFDELTDFGKSGWFLVPTGVALLAIAALASPALPHMSRLVLTAVSLRIGFVFLAVGVPGLAVAVVKRLVGRARPFVGPDGADPFLYLPFGWDVEYASLPSGHATNAFGAALAIGALWPRLRPLMWTYAILIAVSRVVLTAHHPSDVLAGAVFGTVGALLVRDWFAARGLAFTLAPDGAIRPLPGPSFTRLKRVARQLLAP
jgi:membrane-associated phospholipid phosphatase